MPETQDLIRYFLVMGILYFAFGIVDDIRWWFKE